MRSLFLVYLFVLSAASLTALVLYGADKLLAVKGTARIPERYLLGIAAAGGAVGALLGRILFRHKTQKTHFSFVISTALCLQLLTGVALFLSGGHT